MLLHNLCAWRRRHADAIDLIALLVFITILVCGYAYSVHTICEPFTGDGYVSCLIKEAW